jgi:hypothetical protein
MRIVVFLILAVLARAQDYQIWRTGNAGDVQTASVTNQIWVAQRCIMKCLIPLAVWLYLGWNCVQQGGAVLMGGGTDVEAAFIWHSRHARGGDFVILRASGSDGYNQWLYDLARSNGVALNSVTSILCNNRNASYSPVVQQYVV